MGKLWWEIKLGLFSNSQNKKVDYKFNMHTLVVVCLLTQIFLSFNSTQGSMCVFTNITTNLIDTFCFAYLTHSLKSSLPSSGIGWFIQNRASILFKPLQFSLVLINLFSNFLQNWIKVFAFLLVKFE